LTDLDAENAARAEDGKAEHPLDDPWNLLCGSALPSVALCANKGSICGFNRYSLSAV
jgi:hypothetical protein